MGRELVTAGGRRHRLPLFLPVYQRNATLPELPPAIGDQPIHGCIVNAYFLYKQRELRRSLAETAGLRQYLGFDGLVMTDSGAFQAFTRRLYLNNRDITRFQARIGADIVSPLDLITLPGESRTSVEVKVDATFRRVREAQRYVGDALLAGVQQGGRFLEARRTQLARMALGRPMVRVRRRLGRSGSFADLTLATENPIHGEHQTGVRQRDHREHNTHRARVAELALGERGSEKLLGHHKGGVIGAATRLQSSHVDDGIQR